MTDQRLQQFLLSSFDYFANRTVQRLAGLTDDEYFWEPVDGCWSVRKGSDGWTADWEMQPPDPAPVTTIAWRLVHVVSCVQEHGLRWVAFERGKAQWRPPSVIPGSAAEAISALDKGVATWKRDLQSVDDTRLWEPIGPEGGPYAEEPVVAFVEHIHDEFIHHSAEIALLRDLYRAGR